MNKSFCSLPMIALTLNVMILKRDTLPPEVDTTYESFLEIAQQCTAFSGLASLISLVIITPRSGCHNSGGKLAVACQIEIQQ